MILGFAHITKNETGYGPAFDTHVPVESAPEKWPLMAERATSHYVVLGGLFLPPDPNVPLEVIKYDTDVVKAPGRLGAFGADIAMRVHDMDKEYRFFVPGLGFSAELGKLYLSSAFDRWSVRIHTWVDPDPFAPIDPPLDIAGYAALAFYSSDVEADRDHLLKHGGRTPTEPFTVKLDREMKIVMLRSPEGTIIELIQVMP
jgi:hypothetical protein